MIFLLSMLAKVRDGDRRQTLSDRRALCWHGKGDVRVDTVPDPVIQHPRDAIVRIMACAICGAMRQGDARAKPYRQAGPSRPVPTIVFHGDRETTVRPVNGDQVIAQAKAGADLTRAVDRAQSQGGIKYTCVSEKDRRGRTVLEHWTRHGCGHAWSGGSTEGSYTEPRGPDASREMIRFFLQHRASDGE